MSSLDSRALQPTDCYAKKFTGEGKISYRFAPASGACTSNETGTFVIEVGKGKRKETRQHNITVRLKDRQLVADPDHLEIQSEDMVLWHAQDQSARAFIVRGEGPDGKFNSGSLEQEEVFTHAFGSPGTYEWKDANGSSVSGFVEVTSPDAQSDRECEQWMKSLAEGKVIHISGTKVRPDEVKIKTGQTVFWAVEKAPGITITDRRLIFRSARD